MKQVAAFALALALFPSVCLSDIGTQTLKDLRGLHHYLHGSHYRLCR